MKCVSFPALSAATAALMLSGVGAWAKPGVVSTAVNLRQGAGTSTPILAKIPGGSAVDVAGCSGEWCQVTYAGKSGYVIATALGQGAPPPAGPPPGAPPPGYVPPPAAAYVPPPYYYGPYYYGPGPYWGWGGCCWRGGWGRRW